MKKPRISLLAFLTCLFLAFALGFFLGKNRNHETVQLSVLPSSPENAAPIETAAQDGTMSAQISFPVDVNTADMTELCALPGIGETLARRILEYREQYGRFERPEELLNVEGIGSGKLEALLDYVTTGG